MTQICNFLICIKKKGVCTTNKPNCSKTETPNRHLLIDAIYLVDLVKDSALGNQMMQRYVTNTRNMYKKCNIYPSFRISERCECSNTITLLSTKNVMNVCWPVHALSYKLVLVRAVVAKPSIASVAVACEEIVGRLQLGLALLSLGRWIPLNTYLSLSVIDCESELMTYDQNKLQERSNWDTILSIPKSSLKIVNLTRMVT